MLDLAWKAFQSIYPSINAFHKIRSHYVTLSVLTSNASTMPQHAAREVMIKFVLNSVVCAGDGMA